MKYRDLPFLSSVAVRIISIVCAAILPFNAISQQINGVTGLLSMPSAEMQPDGTAMVGGNFLNKHIVPPVFGYNTYNYYLNVTFLPFMEVAYSCTFFRRVNDGKAGKIFNQDRNFSLRLRALRESKYVPAIVVGSNDAYTTKGDFMSKNKKNQYFGSIYIAASKHFMIGQERIGANLSYIYGPRGDSRLKGFAAGVSYSPSIARSTTLIAEYDASTFNVGAQALLFNHLFAQVILQDVKYFSAGLAYKIYLKKDSRPQRRKK